MGNGSAKYFSWLKSYFIGETETEIKWNTHEIFVRNFRKIFKQRLNDQFIQEWKSNVLSSERFPVLSILFNRYEMSAYITAVKNPDIRNIYTRRRIDMNVLSTSHSCKNIKYMCPLCHTEPETVSHFILKCSQLSYLWGKFYDNVSSHSPDLKDKNEMTELKYIFDFQCPPDTVRYCCQYIRDIYCFRGKCDK